MTMARPSILLPFDKGFIHPSLTLSRSSVKTVYGSDGLLKTVPANMPAIDHDPTTGECRGISIEEARTNLAAYSNDFSNAWWAKNRFVLTPAAAIGPDGTLSATKFIPDTTVNNHSLTAAVNPTASPGQIGFFAIYAKAAEYSRLRFRMASGATIIDDIVLDALTGLKLTGTSTNYTAQALPNGWYRFAVWSTMPSDAVNFYPAVWVYDNTGGAGASSYAGDGSGGVLLYGAEIQVFNATTPVMPYGSHIPTAGASATRAADNSLAIPAGSWLNPYQGTIAVEFTTPVVLQQRRAIGLYASSTNRVHVSISNLNTINVFGSAVGNTATASATGTAVGADGQLRRRRCALTYNGNFVQFGIDASGVGLAGASAPFDMTGAALYLGNFAGSTEWLNGWISRASYSPLAMTAAQLQALNAA